MIHFEIQNKQSPNDETMQIRVCSSKRKIWDGKQKLNYHNRE